MSAEHVGAVENVPAKDLAAATGVACDAFRRGAVAVRVAESAKEALVTITWPDLHG